MHQGVFDIEIVLVVEDGDLLIGLITRVWVNILIASRWGDWDGREIDLCGRVSGSSRHGVEGGCGGGSAQGQLCGR